jgi:DNA-directed RNA polymerase subunit K/omega
MPESRFVRPESKFDDMLRAAHRAKQLTKGPGVDLRDVSKAVEMLAEVVEELLKEQGREQQREEERRLRDADTEPPPSA